MSEETSAVPRPPSGHPHGLWVLFITEMWERFSYYGMRALLVLYLIATTSETLPDGSGNPNPGFGWTETQAYELYGWYTFSVYLTPIAGGWLADRFLGTHRSMIVGGWIIALGHITLAFTEFFGITPGKVVSLQTSPGALITFISGLALIVIGTGFFKPCVSVMVGQLYASGDPRRDSGFTIFYMGINVGALLSPLVAGTLGETVGWHYGFGSAAVGMILGLVCYQFLRPKYLKGIGLPPQKDVQDPAGRASPVEANSPSPGPVEKGSGRLTRIEYERLAVILILAVVGNSLFWSFFEQQGSSLTVFAKANTDRDILGYTFPATWYQAINPFAIIAFGPVFSWLWVRLDRLGANPSTPLKFALGQWLLGLAFVFMIFGSMAAQGDGLAGPQWLFLTLVVITWGELCLSPVGLSMVTKLAPERLQSLMMGIWFLSWGVSNLIAAQLAKLSRAFLPGENGLAEHTFILPGLPGFFLLLVVLPLGGGLVIALFSPILRKMMHGVP